MHSFVAFPLFNYRHYIRDFSERFVHARDQLWIYIVRAALGVKPGDLLVYRIAKGGKVTLAKGEPIDRAYLKAVENTLSEWASPADKAAYDDL